jgi:hypothetical protein
LSPLKVVKALARFLRPGGAKESQGSDDQQLSVLPTPREDKGTGDGLAADPGLPHLEAARDPELMREVFLEHLRPLGEKVYEVRECRIPHVRYQPATRCLLQYILQLQEPDTGHKRSQRVTGVMYARGRTRKVWEKLQRSEPRRETPGATPAFEPYAYIPQLDMLVQVFPYDHQLPALPLLVAGPPPELEPLCLDRFGAGDWRAEAWEVETVRYLAESRATLRLTARAREIATGRVEEKRFYAKVYKDQEKGEQTYQVLRALWEKAGEGFTVGMPIAYLSELRTLIQEEVPGLSLQDMLLRGDEAIPAMHRAARALAALHLDDAVTPQHRYPRDEVIAILEKQAKALRRACPRLGPDLEKVLDTIVAGLEEVPPAPTHGDLNLRHIMFDGDRLVLLDLDDFVGADPVLDVARALAHLAAMTHRFSFPRDRARAAAQVFVDEYFARVPKTWRMRLPLHYAGALLKIAPGFFRNPKPNSAETVEALIAEAKDSLAGRLW